MYLIKASNGSREGLDEYFYNITQLSPVSMNDGYFLHIKRMVKFCAFVVEIRSSESLFVEDI